MLIDNVNFLKQNYIKIYEQMKEIEEYKDQSFVQLEETKNGQKTLKVKKEGVENYIHSKYDPLREAKAIVEEYKNTEQVNQNTHVIFFGIGLGYHINILLQKHSDISFSIYEPIKDILYQYLSNEDLKQLPLKNMYRMEVENTKEDTMIFLTEHIKDRDKKILIFPLPSYRKLFSESYETFLSSFRAIARGERSSLHVNYAFQKRWILNSMINFKEVLNSPNILLNKKGQFKGKPAILVAAGPSLDEEIENLRHIKENGLAYIFTVGSAINTLVHHNIYPHAACTYDPTELNQMVFEKVAERGITDIPLIFGSSVGYETLQKYPGKKIHMITSQDTTAQFYLKSKTNDPIEGVIDAPTIAVITLQLLYQLGFDTIILAGQNLAYKGERGYAGGIDYHGQNLPEHILKNALKVKDVHGNEILTNDSYNSMRQQMEFYIQKYSKIHSAKVLNTTKGGAHIEGSEFIPLKELIEKELNESVVDENWLMIDENNYDSKYLNQQKKKMQNAYGIIANLLKEIDSILDKIEKLCRNRNFNQVERMYHILDASFKKIKENCYFEVFVSPMNRVFYQLLNEELHEIQYEKNKIKKAEKVINAFGKFLFECRKDMEKIEQTYQEIQNAVEEYIQDQNKGEKIEVKKARIEGKEEIEVEQETVETNKINPLKINRINIGDFLAQNNKGIIGSEKRPPEIKIDKIIDKKSEETLTKKEEQPLIKKLLISPKASLKSAMQIIDKGAKGIALVVDEAQTLLGTLTDGDIRRAILRGSSLEDLVENVMNHKFIFVSENYSEKLVKTIFKQKSILQIPILDDEMKIVDIIFYQNFNEKPSKENWALIMAGGQGTRLQSLTDENPKPMLKIGSKPILEIIIEQLKSHGYKNILLAVNYKAHIIENYFQDGSNLGVNIQYIKEEKPLGTAGAIKLAKEYLKKPFLVINGDLLTKLNFEEILKHHQKYENTITLAAKKHEVQIPYGVLEIDDESIISIQEKPVSNVFINGGIYCLNPDMIEYIPENEYFNITQLIQKALDEKQKIGSFPITEYWMDIGQLDDYHQANVDYEYLFGREVCGVKA